MRASQSERRILTDAILTEVLIREHSRTNALESRTQRKREPDTNRPGETHFATFSADSSNEVVGCIARTFLSVLITRGAMHYLLGPVRTFALYNARPDESCIGIGRYTYHAAAYYMHAESMAHREKKRAGFGSSLCRLLSRELQEKRGNSDNADRNWLIFLPNSSPMSPYCFRNRLPALRFSRPAWP